MSDENSAGGRKRDAWEKLDILFKGITALAVGGVGLIGSIYLQGKQESEAKVQLYTQLMSSREQTDSDLRKEMFNSIITEFLAPQGGGYEDKVLAVELLTYNFHDVLDLGPLFKHLQRKITGGPQTPETEDLADRLQRVSAQVIDKQLAGLKEVGEVKRENVYFDHLRQSTGGITVLDSEFSLPGRDGGREWTRRFVVQVLAADENTHELQVRLEASPLGQSGRPEEDVTFWISFSDFPLIDNTRLRDGDRMAIVLQRWEEDGAELAFAYFPGSRASLKDKLYYDEIIQEVVTKP